jgi:hypothetical protein
MGTGYDSTSANPGSCLPCAGLGYIAKDKIDITSLQADIDKILRRLKKIMDKLEITE